jgi:hypothetical protein
MFKALFVYKKFYVDKVLLQFYRSVKSANQAQKVHFFMFLTMLTLNSFRYLFLVVSQMLMEQFYQPRYKMTR